MSEREVGRSWSDEALFARVQDTAATNEAPSPTEALGILFERYHVRVLRHCEKILREPAEAEDATHEVFVALLTKARPYQSRENFGAWLYVVTRNHCLNLLRRHRREISHEDWELVLDADAPEDPDLDVARRSLVARIEEFCRRELSVAEQRVVRLRFGWGFSVKQIDALLDLDNASGSRTHLSTATRKLREAFASPGTDSDGERRGT